VNKFSYAGIAILSLILDVLIHVNSISRDIDTGTVATVGQIAIAVAASSLALAGITGQQSAQSGKLDTIVDQTDGHLQVGVAENVAAVLDQKGITDAAVAAKKVLNTADTAASVLAAQIAQHLAALQSASAMAQPAAPTSSLPVPVTVVPVPDPQPAPPAPPVVTQKEGSA